MLRNIVERIIKIINFLDALMNKINLLKKTKYLLDFTAEAHLHWKIHPREHNADKQKRQKQHARLYSFVFLLQMFCLTKHSSKYSNLRCSEQTVFHFIM